MKIRVKGNTAEVEIVTDDKAEGVIKYEAEKIKAVIIACAEEVIKIEAQLQKDEKL